VFTGIVEELGEVVRVEELGDSARIRIRGPRVAEGARHGDSIAVNGVCLTVIEGEKQLAEAEEGWREAPQQGVVVGRRAGEFTADVMAETLHRSSLGTLGPGSRVNLERAMALGDRLGGHIMQGHVDATGALVSRSPGEPGADGRPQWEVLRFTLPASIARYVVEKGSISVDGVSLTVVEAGADSFTVSLIPTTLEATTLGRKEIGEPVNLEADILAKHVERLLAARGSEVGA
jgi:riboflavin synthase